MKILFFSCLVILMSLCKLNASTDLPQDLNESISNSKIKDKPRFIDELKILAIKHNICPKLLFSLGIEKWEKLNFAQQKEELNDLANLAPYIKDSAPITSKTP